MTALGAKTPPTHVGHSPRIDTFGASWHGLRMEVYNAKLLTTTTTALWRVDLL